MQGQVQPIGAVDSQIRDESSLIQSLAQIFAGLRLVFNDEYFQELAPCPA
jgi:hypothetical protein